MKIILLMVVLGILSSCQTQQLRSLNGLWQDSSGSEFSNCYASYHVENGNLSMIHFFHYQGKPFFEKGEGTFKDGVLKYRVQVLQTIDDWPRKGYHELTLSADGNSLEGFYISASGDRGALKLKKRR